VNAVVGSIRLGVVGAGLVVVGACLVVVGAGLVVGLGHLESLGFNEQLGGHLGSLSAPGLEHEKRGVVSGGRYVGACVVGTALCVVGAARVVGR
jgi:hypothetical protein